MRLSLRPSDPAVVRRFASTLLSGGLLCGVLLPVMAGAQATQYKEAPPLLVGAAWYPEQWG